MSCSMSTPLIKPAEDTPSNPHKHKKWEIKASRSSAKIPDTQILISLLAVLSALLSCRDRKRIEITFVLMLCLFLDYLKKREAVEVSSKSCKAGY